MVNNKVYAVVLVGGKGKRLMPLSTAALPKAFLSITKDRRTMFRRTLDRVRAFAKDKDIVVVANKAHAKLVRKDFPEIAPQNLLLEPASRNTAPAIALAAATVEKMSPGAIMAVLPTDQYIKEEEKFVAPVKSGINFIKRNPDAIVVMGVKPRYPSAHFGYIKIDRRAAGKGRGGMLKVKKFVEKPDRKLAQKYIKSGQYLWNTGAFIFKAGTLLGLIKKLSPRIYKAVTHPSGVRAGYRTAPDISIDYAIMEKARNIYCVEASYEWHDLGGFESLIKILTREGRGFEMRGGKVVKIR
ncbi:MAG: sugar phosphate nucleotidyltransferase [Candidatus Omnitrophica bacterium]|nr:sugar phosphate nucleotidyltransferase [Candidatus Omnitrophota bacterium]